MANNGDPEQTAPIGAICSGSTLFAPILNSSCSNVRQLFAADDFSRQHFQMHFFLGALRVKRKIWILHFVKIETVRHLVRPDYRVYSVCHKYTHARTRCVDCSLCFNNRELAPPPLSLSLSLY